MNLPTLAAHATNPNVFIKNDKAVTTSQDVAAYFIKRHERVLDKIRSLECSLEFTEHNFVLSEYTDSTGRKLPMYQMTKDGFVFLVMGFTGKKAAAFKEAYIAEFNRMEANLRQPAKASSGKITPELQNIIKELVKSRAEKLPQDKRAKATWRMWSVLNSYGGKSYKDISQDQFTDAISLVGRLPLEGEYIEHNPQSSTVIAPHRECLPKMVYHSTNKHKPYRAYAWDGVKKRTYLGSYPVVEEAVAAQEHFMQKGATEGIQTDLKFVPKDGRYTVRIEEGQVVAAKAIADKSLVDTKAYRRLRTDILTAQSVLNELLNRMRIVQGEQSISCVDTPLLEAITR